MSNIVWNICTILLLEFILQINNVNSLYQCHSLNQDINECIPDDNQNFLAYPLYYIGTTRCDYQIASFVLGKISVTITEMHAVFPPDHVNIGTRQVGTIG